MAARKKNTGSRRRSSAANGSRSTKSRNQTTVRSKKPAATVKTRTEPAASGTGVGRDIILVLILLCSVILFICVLGFGGRFGKGISYGLFGLFGKMAYVFPLALFGGTAFYIANKKNGMIIRKMVGLIMLFIFMCVLLHILTLNGQQDRSTRIPDYYRICAENKTGGGIIAGVFAYAAAQIGFNTVLSIVLTVCMIFIALIIMTQKPLFTKLGRRGRDGVRRAREGQRELRKRRLRKREARQMELDFNKEQPGKKKNRPTAIPDDFDDYEDDFDDDYDDDYYNDFDDEPENDGPVSAREAVRLHTRKKPSPSMSEDDLDWDEMIKPAKENRSVRTETPEAEAPARKKRRASESRRKEADPQPAKRRSKNRQAETPARKEEDDVFINLKDRITINGEQLDSPVEVEKSPDEESRKKPNDLVYAGGSAMPSFLHGVLAGKDTKAATENVGAAPDKKKRAGHGLPEFDAEGDEILANGVMEILASEDDDEDVLIEGSEKDPDDTDMTLTGFEEEEAPEETAEEALEEAEEEEDDTRYIPLSEIKVGEDGKLSYERPQQPKIKSATIKRNTSSNVREAYESAYDDSEKPKAEEEEIPARSPKKKPKSTEQEIEEGVISIDTEIKKTKVKPVRYKLPSVNLLTKGETVRGDSRKQLLETASKLEEIFGSFGVAVHVINVSKGPTVTRYELQPEQGVKVSRIVSLTDDIKLNLAASEIRIEAPIPGKAAVGIEVPNKEVSPVTFRDMIESQEYRKSKAPLTFAVGKDISGKAVVSDIAKMPHLLIAGATGSGKSVCINTLIMSVLYKSTPDEVKMLMIDPKVVEFKIYDGIPHLLIPVVTDPKKAAGALNWAVHEMNDRYNKFSEYAGVRDLKSYNQRIDRINEALPEEERKAHLPQILIIVDELADLMMVAPGEVEDAICRLAQLARAAGIHLVIATQRPSVNVVTGLIKANMPSRIALSVSSGVDSRTIIDMNGAEKLLGNGDMLYYPQGYPKPARLQGAFVSDDDITKVVNFLSSQSKQVVYNNEVEDKIIESMNNSVQNTTKSGDDRDPYFIEAGRFIIEKDKASIGMLQRMFKIGFNRAARIMDQLCEAGVVGPEEGTKPRKILMSKETFDDMFEAE